MPYEVVATIRRQFQRKVSNSSGKRNGAPATALISVGGYWSTHPGMAYLPAPAAIFLTIAITSLRSLSFKLGE
jgi:hypothetical protein